MSGDTIWRWFCSLSEADLAEPNEPILELRRRNDATQGFEPVLLEDPSDGALPELSLP